MAIFACHWPFLEHWFLSNLSDLYNFLSSPSSSVKHKYHLLLFFFLWLTHSVTPFLFPPSADLFQDNTELSSLLLVLDVRRLLLFYSVDVLLFLHIGLICMLKLYQWRAMTCDIVTSARLLIVAMNDWELDKYMVTHYRPECKEEQKKKNSNKNKSLWWHWQILVQTFRCSCFLC